MSSSALGRVMTAGEGEEATAPAPPRRRMAAWLGGTALVLGALGLGAYALREPISERLIARYLDSAGVSAQYRLESLGPRHQRLSDIRIGDPRRPDFAARQIDIWIGYGWTGPRIARVRVRGALLRARFDGDRLRLGALDRLLPAPSDEPLQLPDLAFDIADAAAAIETPWGPVTLGVVGRGHLQRDYAGVVAGRAPRLAGSGCVAEAARLRLAFSGDADGLIADGPITAPRVNCEGGYAARGVTLTARAAVPLTLDSATLSARIAAGTLAAGTTSAEQLAGRGEARWSIRDARASGFVSLRAEAIADDLLYARGGALRGDFGWAQGEWRFAGSTALTGATVAAATRESAVALRRQGDAPVIGPLLAQLGTAAEAALGDFTLVAPLQATGGTRRARIVVPRIVAEARSGARLALDGADRGITYADGALSVEGALTLHGGGFPRLDGRVARGGDGSTRLAFLPFRAQTATAALAVDRLTVALDSVGNGRFEIAAGLSGPMAGGRVDGLALALGGQIGGDGAVTIDGGCRNVGYRRVQISGASLDRGSMTLCSLPGQPLLAYAGGQLRGGVSSGPLRLFGRLGGSDFAIAAQALRYAWSGRGEAGGVTARIGDDDAAVRLTADRLTLAATGAVPGGQISGATARIGAVPFNLDGISGDWRLANGRLVLDGRVDITDPPRTDSAGEGQIARFRPLAAPAMRLTLDGNRIEADGRLVSRANGVAVADVALRHDLARGVGDARFTLVPLRFARDALQPEVLSDLTRGVVAEVEAIVTGAGRLDWDAAGVRSSGEFSTSDANLAAAFGPVRGMTGTIRFNDLVNLATPPGQRVRLASVNPGIEVTDGAMTYQLLPGQQVRIEGGQWPFAGGTLRLHPALLNFAADQPRYLTFDVEAIDAARFLQRYGFENISATGVFDGVLPTVFDADGGRVVDGTLVVRDGGGTLAYVGELTTRDLGYFGNMAFGALRSLEYETLRIRLNGNIDGEMLTEVAFAGLGQGSGVQNNFFTRQLARLPFAFNISINAPFRALLSSARSLYDPTILIEQNLPTLIREDAAARARQQQRQGQEQQPLGTAPVQQQESGDVRQQGGSGDAGE